MPKSNAIFYLPGVIEHVLGDPPDEKAQRPDSPIRRAGLRQLKKAIQTAS
jgi:hypothetical protein